MEDITKTGPKGLKGLKGLSQVNSMSERELNDYLSSFSAPRMENIVFNNAPTLSEDVEFNTGVGIGDSMWDNKIYNTDEIRRAADVRANNQPWYSKIGAGIGKGAVIASTTFADGIAGTFAGIANVLAESGNIHSWRDLGDKFVNNPVSQTLQSVNDWAEKAMPNYYTEYEQSSPWWENIFTANFIGDKFLKNFGFTVGAAYSGRVSVGVLAKAAGLKKVRDAFKGVVTTASGKELKTAAEIARAYKSGDAFMDGVKITEDLARSAKQLRNAEYGLRAVGAINSAMGEGRIEAISNSKEWFDYNKRLLDDDRQRAIDSIEQQMWNEHPELFTFSMSGDGRAQRQLTPRGMEELQRRKQSVEDKYNQALAKISSDRAKMANRIFALNTALLSASNIYTYGRFLSGGYNTGRQAKNLVTGSIKDGYKANKNIAYRGYAKAASVPFVEMNEEMAQAAISEVAGQKYASELNDFYGAKINPDAEEQTLDWMEAIAEGIANTYGNPDRWEEGFLGFITGGLGMPHISMRADANGKKRPKLTIEGELWEGIRDANRTRKEASDIADALNEGIKGSKFLNYYHGLIRHTKYDNDMEEDLDRGDNFNFKNDEHSQFVNDAIMFDKAGRLQDLYDFIDEAGNVTEENVEEIRAQAKKNDGSPSVFDNMTDEEVVAHITKQANDARAKLDKYVEISNNLKTLYGDNISSDHLEELTWMMTQIDDWEKRTKSLIGDINKIIESKSKELNERFGVDISAELGNLESMFSALSKEDNVVDQINRIVNDKNIPIEEGRRRIEELIKAKELERNTSGLRLGNEIRHIRKVARERRESLEREFKKGAREFGKERERDSKTKRRLYNAYLQELDRLSQQVEQRIRQRSKEEQENASDINRRYYYPVGITEDIRKQAIDAFEDYYRRTSNLDESLRYAEEMFLDRMVVKMSRYEGERGKSAFEAAKEAFARNRQRKESSALFSQIVALKEMLDTDYRTVDPLNVKQISEKFMDLLKLYAARAKFIDKYMALSEHPEMFTEEVQRNIAEVTKHIRESEVNRALEKLNNISTVNELRSSLSDIDESVIGEVLDRFAEKSDSSKALVDNLRKLEDYSRTLSEIIEKIPNEEADLRTSLSTVVIDAFDGANSVDEVEAVLSDAINKLPPDLGKNLKKVLDKARNNLSSKKASTEKDSNKPEKKVKKKSGFSLSSAPSNMDEVGDIDNKDNEGEEGRTDRNVSGKSEIEKELEDKSVDELEDISKGKVPEGTPKEEAPKVRKLAGTMAKNKRLPKADGQAEGTNSEDNNPSKERTREPHLRSWYHTKYRFDELKDRNIRRAERYNSTIVDALDELGAYDFVDEGKLGLLFDSNPNIPIYYVKVKDSRLKDIVVLAVKVTPEVQQLTNPTTAFEGQDGNRYQAVGALGFDPKNSEAVKGFRNIISNFNDEYEKYLENNSEPQFFVDQSQTNKIKHIYSGRMVKTLDENSPRQKPLASIAGNRPVLGIYYGNRLRVPMLDDQQEIVPLNSNNVNPRDGSVWLMSREADGRWYAKAVKVKRFTLNEYDVTEHYDTPIMRQILEDLRILADPEQDIYDRSIAKYDLMNLLYFPEGTEILFNKDTVSISGLENDIGAGLNVEEKVQAILNALQDESLNLRFQVDPSQLSEELYVKDLLDSDILTTDLAIAHNVNASFDLFITDAEGSPQGEAVRPKGHTGRKGINNAIASRTLTLNGTEYSVTENEIRDSKGDVITDPYTIEELTLLQKIEEGSINPVEGSNRLFLGVHAMTGQQFGISGGHVITGEKLDRLLENARKKADKAEKKVEANTLFEQVSNENLARLSGLDEEEIETDKKPRKAFSISSLPETQQDVKPEEVEEKSARQGSQDAPSGKKSEEPNSPVPLFESPVQKNLDKLAALEEPEEKVHETTKKPKIISDTFVKGSAPTLKELNEKKDNPDFQRLAKSNRRALADLGFKSVSELVAFVNDPVNKMPAIETIDSQDKFEALLDTIKNCR